MFVVNRGQKVLAWCLVLVSLTLYWVALNSTVIGGFWTGPDIDHPPRSGWWCLLWGWNPLSGSPFGWLVNPLYFFAIFFLLKRRLATAALFSNLAMVVTIVWRYTIVLDIPEQVIEAGYDWWRGGIAVLALGNCALFLIVRLKQLHA